MTPLSFRPDVPADFIGSAASIAQLLFNKATRLKTDPNGCFHALFYGVPGTGKSALARVVARHLAGHELAIEHLNGQSMSVELVREWRRNVCYRPLYGDWTVKLVDEIDRSSDAAQAELLTHLDRRQPGTAFIATTNVRFEQIPERNQTRMQLFKFKPVSDHELAAWLVQRWSLSVNDAARIAEGNRGNVRGALNDTETLLDRLALNAA